MYAYVKNGVLDSFSEEFFPKQVPEKFEDLIADDGSGTVIGLVSVSPEIPGLVYDEAIKFDFEDTPVYEDGEIVPYSESMKKVKDDAERSEKEWNDSLLRKKEILATVGILSNERAGLVALGFDAKDPEISDIDAKIEALRTEYGTL